MGAALSVATVATAQVAPPVTTTLDPCVPVDGVQFQRLLAIELGTSGAGQARGAAHVSVTCSELGIELRLDDSVTRKSMSRVLPAESFRDASSSTRLLALAVAEFVVASWIELTVQPEPAVEPVGPPPPATVKQAASRVARDELRAAAPPNTTLSAAFSMQAWSEHDGVLIGAGLRILQRPLEHLAWTVSGDFGLTRVDTRLGEVTIGTASALAAIALAVPLPGYVLYTGAGGRVGFTRMEGEPDDPGAELGRRFFAPWGGPAWFARAEAQITRAFLIGLEMEAGLVTLPTKAVSQDEVLIALDGVWISGGVVVGFAF
jgi:hypothetical protein